jgi:hypothetical protein
MILIKSYHCIGLCSNPSADVKQDFGRAGAELVIRT